MDPELLLGQRAIERGWVRPDQIQGCLREISPGVRLQDLLVRKGLLTREQANELEGVPDGERIGKYVKTSRLGAGGMGEVWKAWDTELRRWVALKFLKNVEGDDLARFRREAQTAAQLSHPGIAAVYEADETFIAMQYIAGTTLDAVTDRRKAVELVRQAALAVHYAHDRGVVHRDLKPANIMVQDGRAFVMDFGLAKLLDVRSSISVTGTLVGTPAFMSPEQARTEATGPRTDVYGLGATLYALVAGRPPFVGDHPYQIIGRVISEDPPPPRGDPELDVIVMKCLEKDPARRYATALEFAKDLERWLQGEPIHAHAPTLFYRVRKKISRHRVGVIAAAVVVLALAFGATMLIRKNQRIEELLAQARRERDPAAARDAYRAVLELNPSNREALEGVARIEEAQREVAGLQEAARNALDVAFRHYYEPQYRHEELMRRVARARTSIERALELEPGSPVTLILLGRAFELEGEDGEAIRQYRRALEIDPSSAPARYRLGRLLVEQGFLSTFVVDGDGAGSSAMLVEGRAELERCRGLSGLEERVHQEVAQGILAYTRADWPVLREVVDRGLRDFEEGREEFHWLAGLAAPEAERLPHYDRALEIRPRFLLALFSRAVARRKSGDLRGAIDDYSTVLSIKPNLAFAYLNRGEARDEGGDAEGALADATEAIRYGQDAFLGYVNRVAAYVKLGRLDEALRDAETAVGLRPASSRTWSALGAVKYARGDYRGAVEACTRSIDLKATVAEPYYNRGCVRLVLKEFAEAEEDFKSALQLFGPSSQLYCCLGQARRGRKDPAGALRAFDEAAKRNPESAEAHGGRAEALHALGKSADALLAITKAIGFGPKADYFAFRGDLHLERKDDRAAVTDLTEAIRLGRKDGHTYYQRAFARQGLGDLPGAEADLTEVLRQDPASLDALYNRAGVRAGRADYVGAIADMTELVRHDPNNAKALLHRAGFKAKIDDLDGAKKDAEEAVRLAPNDPEAYIARGNLRSDVRDQIRDYEKALEVAPRNWPLRAQVEAALEKLKKP